MCRTNSSVHDVVYKGIPLVAKVTDYGHGGVTYVYDMNGTRVASITPSVTVGSPDTLVQEMVTDWLDAIVFVPSYPPDH